MNALLTALKCRHLQFGFAILIGMVIINLALYSVLSREGYLLFLAAIAGSQFGDWSSKLATILDEKLKKQ